MSLSYTCFVFATLLAVILLISSSSLTQAAQQQASLTTPTVPSKVTECYNAASGGSTAFCEQLRTNTSWAVTQQFAPAIATGAAVFGPRPWIHDEREGKNIISNTNNKNNNNNNLLHRLRQQQKQKKVNLQFPGWTKASKRVITSNGRYTYDDWTATVDDAISQFDMASCSKIMASTTAAAQLYQLGFIDLDEKVASPRLLGPNFANKGKGEITIRNLLLHNAGYPPDPNPFYNEPNFPCKNNLRYHPDQNFDCVETIYDNLLFNQTLQYPTGSKYVYSDLSMITLMYVVAKVVDDNNLVAASDYPLVCKGVTNAKRTCPFYAWVQNNVFKRYNLESTLYIPSSPIRTIPEWNSSWHHGLIQGYVSDQNCYALGGISGHAGVFSTARDALTFMSIWMDNQDPAMLNETTVQLFTTVYNTTQSSRALGWDTNLDPNHACGGLSLKTFFHIGFTGTQFCGDPTTGTVTVLLGNGRYPDFNKDGMITYRPMYNTLVNDLLK